MTYLIFSNDNSTSVGTIRKNVRVRFTATNNRLDLVQQGSPEQFNAFNLIVTIQYTKD